MPEVGYERRGAAAVITIDRPERRNAVDPSTADQLLEAYRGFESDDEARVMILTGAGDEAFCAGADLKSVAAAMNDQGIAQQWLKPRPDGPLGSRAVAVETDDRRDLRLGARRRTGTGALVRLRDRTETARLGFPERRWGVLTRTQRLPRIVGMGRALDMIRGLIVC
jgi:enoyl-CoA hydratase